MIEVSPAAFTAPSWSAIASSFELVSASDLAAVARGTTLRVPEGALVTELARDEARRRNITLLASSGANVGVRSDARLRVAIGADHGGFPLKQAVVEWVRELGHVPLDLGTKDENPVDYPDYAEKVALAVKDGRAERAVLICGSGVGACVAANKVPGIRAAICHDAYSAHQCVEHDDMNVLVLGGRIIGSALAHELVEAFVKARYTAEERHARRLAKVNAIEARYSK